MTTKLVRDKIPQIIKKHTGKSVKFEIASSSKMTQLLKKKLKEEIKELEIAIKNKDVKEITEEMADVKEVLNAISKHEKIPLLQVEKRRKEKLRQKGGFKERIVMNFSRN